MEITYLKEFLKTAEIGNYLAASEELFMSQSSLSKHIQALEKELNVPLFNRTTRKVELTEYGEAFIPICRQIISQYQKYLNQIKEIDSKIKETLCLGVIPSFDSVGLTKPLSDLFNNHNHYNVRLVEDDTANLYNALKEGTVSMAFLYCDPKTDDGIIKIFFVEDHLVLVTPVDSKLGKHKTLSINDLKNESLTLLESHSYLKKVTIEAFKKAGIEPNIVYTQRRFLSAFDLKVNKNSAIFFARDANYVNNPANNVIDIIPEIKVTLCLCYLKNHNLSKAERDFISIIKKSEE